MLGADFPSDSVAENDFIFENPLYTLRCCTVPLFMAKKEVFAWLRAGTKTIDVRKGNPRSGDLAVFQSGANYLELPIIKKETGKLAEVINSDNYKLVIPTARTLEEALGYLQRIYPFDAGRVFREYHLAKLRKP
jgi:hypothetical protein